MLGQTGIISTALLDAPEAGSYRPHVAFDSEDMSAARMHGLRYKDRARSEDSLAVITNYTGATPLASTKAKMMMSSVLENVRDRVSELKGDATFVGTMTAADGVAYCSVGDSGVFVQGNKGIMQLNTPQVAIGNQLTNGIVGFDGKTDERGFLSYADIRKKVGENARIILCSDGLLEEGKDLLPPETALTREKMIAHQMHVMAERPGFNSFLNARRNEAIHHANLRSHHEAQVGRLSLRSGKNPVGWVNEALANGSRDDISVIILTVPPRDNRQVAAFLSDGMGGVGPPGSGAYVSRRAVTAAQDSVIAQMTARGVALEPEMREMQSFVPETLLQVRTEETARRFDDSVQKRPRLSERLRTGQDGERQR